LSNGQFLDQSHRKLCASSEIEPANENNQLTEPVKPSELTKKQKQALKKKQITQTKKDARNVKKEANSPEPAKPPQPIELVTLSVTEIVDGKEQIKNIVLPKKTWTRMQKKEVKELADVEPEIVN
jgi:hypothetical protein